VATVWASSSRSTMRIHSARACPRKPVGRFGRPFGGSETSADVDVADVPRSVRPVPVTACSARDFRLRPPEPEVPGTQLVQSHTPTESATGLIGPPLPVIVK
jgi:hypothetical protein